MLSYRSLSVEADSEVALATLRRIGRARVARAAGAVVLAALALGAIAQAGLTDLRSEGRGLVSSDGRIAPLGWLLLAWPLALAVALAARGVLRVLPGPARSGAELERRLYALEIPSVALPLTGIALAAPLTIHGLWALAAGGGARFEDWMRLSAVIVGHAHLALVVHAWIFARAVHRRPTNEPLPASSRSFGALAAAVACGALPGGILLAIPPLLVLVTGLAFVPLAYRAVHRTFTSERLAVARSLGAGAEAASASG